MSEWIRSNVTPSCYNPIVLIIGTAIYGYGMLNANVQLLAREVSYLQTVSLKMFALNCRITAKNLVRK